MARLDPADEHIESFCKGLRQVHKQSGSPTLQTLSRSMPSRPSTSQLSDILNGNIKRTPQWDTVSQIITACRQLAEHSGNLESVSPDLFSLTIWRARHREAEKLVEAVNRRPRPDRRTSRAQRSTLPRDVERFIARHDEIATVLQRIRSTNIRSGVVPVISISGMPGIGKTALAVHLAHLESASYESVLYLNLHAHTSGQTPLSSSTALALLLESVGVDARRVPEDLAAREILWRARTKEMRLLIVLDNAVDAAQLEPLLPGAAQCTVLVTSRARMTDLRDATPVHLESLDRQDGIALFHQIAARENLVSSELAAIVDLAGNVPLAIRLLSSRLKHHTTWSSGDLLLYLRRAEEAGDRATREQRTLDAAFELSLEALNESERLVFQSLALHPGTSFDEYQVAALAATTRERARECLETLFDQSLIEEPASHRFELHDLIRDYLRARFAHSQAEGSEAPVARLNRYFLATSQAAARAAKMLPEMAPPDDSTDATTRTFASAAEATLWLRAELPNLTAAVEHSRDAGLPGLLDLPHMISPYLRLSGLWETADALHEMAVKSAALMGDKRRMATAHFDLGVCRRLRGDAAAALENLTTARNMLAGSGRPTDQAQVEVELAVVHRLTGQRAAAMSSLQEAFAHIADAEHLPTRARALTEMGMLRRLAAEHTEATALLEQALDIHRNMSDRLGEAYTLAELGVVSRMAGQHWSAIGLLATARDLYRDLENTLGEANVSTELSSVRFLMNEPAAALDDLNNALELYRSLGDRFGEAWALTEIGVVQRLLGRFDTAEANLRRSNQLYDDLGDKFAHARTKIEIGIVLGATGHPTSAVDLLREALSWYRENDDRLGAAYAMLELGVVERSRGALLVAAGLIRESRTSYSALGSQLGVTNADAELGVTYYLSGEVTDAVGILESTVASYRKLDDRLGEALTLGYLGMALSEGADTHAAESMIRRSVALYQGFGSESGECCALNQLGFIDVLSGNTAEATAAHRAALDIANRIGVPLEVARANWGLGRLALAAEHIEDARALLHEAAGIFDRLGSAESASVDAALSALDPT